MPISRSVFKNFLQNLEGKFIKSSSKSKALIHYPTWCLRRQCTPDLFIYFILPSLYGSSRFLWEPLMVLRELYASSHPRIHCVQEMQVSVKMTHNTELVQRLLSGVLKLGLHGHHGSGKGDAAQLQTIHRPTNDSLRNTHYQGECARALSC